MMTSDKPRTISRRAEIRRRHERRTIPYAFGSEEWIREIKSVYLLWPKEDRRAIYRRSRERRATDRRHHRNNAEQTHFSSQSTEDDARLLTKEEKQMLDDISTL